MNDLKQKKASSVRRMPFSLRVRSDKGQNEGKPDCGDNEIFDENVEDAQVVVTGEGMICDEIESSQFLAKQGIMDHFRNREDL